MRSVATKQQSDSASDRQLTPLWVRMEATTHIPEKSLLTDINGIGPAVFGEHAPSVRTLRTLAKAGVIPYFRIGKLMRFDPRLVRAALELHCLVQAKARRNRTNQPEAHANG